MSTGDVAALGSELDLPAALHATRVTRRRRRADGTTEVVRADVWHLSLSNPAGDRVLSDGEWAEIASDLADRMGFSEAPGRAPCPWVAISHGRSAKGNHHIHMAVSLVREDGTIASTWQDQVKVGEACSVYERRYGLRVVGGRENGTCPAPGRSEIEAARRRGRAEPERTSLARMVRASSVASRDEAEFVRRLRAQGIVVRPYYAKGEGRSEVGGYSAALRPVAGEEPVWFGGGRLSKDLRLPALRQAWPTAAEDRAAALAEWNRDRLGGAVGGAAPGRETKAWPVGAWQEAATQTETVWRSLAAVPIDDRATWAGAASDAAGVVGGLAARLEAQAPGPLSRAADSLANAAQLRRRPSVIRPAHGDLGGVAAVAAQAALGGGVMAWVALVNELGRLAKAIEAAQRARGDRAGSEAATASAMAALEDVHARYSLVGAPGGQTPAGQRPGPGGAAERVPELPGARRPSRRSSRRPRPEAPGAEEQRGQGFER